ncbi:hypothetical protein ACTFIW_003189 [Dictyostelium discoideum]
MDKSILLKYSVVIFSSALLMYSLKKYFISENDINRLSKINENQIKIENIIIYPIKACKGIELKKCKLTEYGFENDRRWMIIYNNRYCAQKAYPILSTIETSFSKDGEFLIISKKGIEKQLKISTKPLQLQQLDEKRIYNNVAMFDNQSQCYDEGDECAQWLDQVIGSGADGTTADKGFRLVQMCPEGIWQRNIRTHMSDNLNANTQSSKLYKNSLSNSCQIMILSKESIHETNIRIDKTRKEKGEQIQAHLGWDRYRPNILISGVNTFEEDNWKLISISSSSSSSNDSNVELTIAEANARCPVVVVDQVNGIMDPYNDDEPLRTLKTFRKVTCKIGEKVLLGTYAVIDNSKFINRVISVGDSINVLKTGFTSNYYSEIEKPQTQQQA